MLYKLHKYQIYLLLHKVNALIKLEHHSQLHQFLCLQECMQLKKIKDTGWYPLFLAPQVGLEPTTTRLTAECSTN